MAQNNSSTPAQRSCEEHEEKRENPLEAFTDRFDEGVNHEDARDTLREYPERWRKG